MPRNCIVYSKFGNRKISSSVMECVLLEESDQKSKACRLFGSQPAHLAADF